MTRKRREKKETLSASELRSLPKFKISRSGVRTLRVYKSEIGNCHTIHPAELPASLLRLMDDYNYNTVKLLAMSNPNYIMTLITTSDQAEMDAVLYYHSITLVAVLIILKKIHGIDLSLEHLGVTIDWGNYYD